MLVCAACALGGARAGETTVGHGKMEVAPARVRSVLEGTYAVRKSGAEVGREKFIRTYYTNNTVVYESVFDVAERPDVTVTGNNRLEIEEDSGYARSYYTYRRTKGPYGESVREVSVEMFSSVAVASVSQDGVESREVLGLPAGCLFVESNTAHHLYPVLERYDRRTGGRQALRAFDPFGMGVAQVALEAAADTTLAGNGVAGGKVESAEPVTRYRYFARGSMAADVFVNSGGDITSIDATLSDLEYVLVSRENRSGAADGGGVRDE
jgi:hypothetical protein